MKVIFLRVLYMSW